MGKSDVYQLDYLDDNERFADQVNGALFKGEQVVKREELAPVDMQAVYLGREAGSRREFRSVVDKARMWRGRLLHILAVENQAYVDYHMVLRNMLSESLSYQKQWKQKKRAHEREKDLKAGTDAFLSGMEKDEKFMPVITLVVYCGMEHPWDGARCLHDLLEVDEELKGFVTNYRLNLYDCYEHDTFEEYKTGLRQLFPRATSQVAVLARIFGDCRESEILRSLLRGISLEVVRYGRDREKLGRLLEENREAYSRIDTDTRELIEVVAKVRLEEEYEVMENGERRYDMCKAFMDMKLEGIEEGMEKGMEKGIKRGMEEGIEKGKALQLIEYVCKKLLKDKPAEVIADELEEDLGVVEHIVEIQRRMGNYDVNEIFRMLQENA